MTLWDRPSKGEPPRGSSDESLCQEVAQGSQEAFLVLFDRYWPRVFQLAYAIIRDEAEAEDLAQALFLEVHASLLRFDSRKGPFRTLLLRYAYTRAIDHRRRLESRRFYSCVQFDDLNPASFSKEHECLSGLSPEEGARLVEQGMQLLDKKQRAAIEGYFFRGLSLNEIADEMGDSFGNARHHLYRGLEKMRKALGPRSEAERAAEIELRIERRSHRTAPKPVATEVSIVRARTI
jgi:RNA polymerase sigma-70 factor (ECF subfamily)